MLSSFTSAAGPSRPYQQAGSIALRRRVPIASSQVLRQLHAVAAPRPANLPSTRYAAPSKRFISSFRPLTPAYTRLSSTESIPLACLIQRRNIATDTHTSHTTTPPPPPAVGTPDYHLPKSSETAVSSIPPPGHPPPAPPAILNALPPKIEEVAQEKVLAKKDEKPKGTLVQRGWATVKKEAAHYWAGTKLLGKEIRISSKLAWKVLNGGTLTRRERRQLKRTTTDLLRLIPFSVFVIVPFMEFLLPVALRLFPNMLPSTFEGEFAAAEKQRKLLRVRIEMAKFLQETVKESGLKAESVVKSDEFKQFFRKVRSTGEKPSHTDIVKVAKLFNDDITLDNLTRPQLVSMCKYININAFGTDNFLKHQIRNKLEGLRIDDMMIHSEGVDSLTTKELQQACQSRGIRTSSVSPAKLREELEQWIELHYTNGISGVLLVLSRTFNFDQKADDILGSLITTLSSLPENLIDEAELGVKDEIPYKQKLEVLQQQQELIEDEAEQEQEEKEARQADIEAKKALLEEAKQKEAKEKEEAEQTEKAEKEAKAAAAPPKSDAEKVRDKEQEAQEQAIKDEEKRAEEEKDARMSKEQLGELAEALNVLTAKNSIVKERNELRSLLQDNLLSEAESKERPDEADQKVIAISKRVRAMIKKIDTQLEKYDDKVGSSLNVIESNEKGQITLADLQRAMRAIKHAPPEEVIEGLGKKLDVDQDGLVELDHVVELAQDDGLGIVLEEEAAQDILNSGVNIRHDKADLKELKPKKEDIISDS